MTPKKVAYGSTKIWPHNSSIYCSLILNYFNFLKGGGGGGVHPDIFVKLVFEIAVAQQSRARDETFEGVVDPIGARGAVTPIFGPILAQLCQIT